MWAWQNKFHDVVVEIKISKKRRRVKMLKRKGEEESGKKYEREKG